MLLRGLALGTSLLMLGRITLFVQRVMNRHILVMDSVVSCTRLLRLLSWALITNVLACGRFRLLIEKRIVMNSYLNGLTRFETMVLTLATASTVFYYCVAFVFRRVLFSSGLTLPTWRAVFCES